MRHLPPAVRRRRRMMGGWLDDVGTIITHPADDVNAIVNVKVDDVIDAIADAPIVGGLAPDVRDFVHGPLRDFAKSEIGAMVLTGVSMGAIAALPFLGPQLTLLAYATPGFIAGGSFGPAWVAGYVAYLRKGIKFLTQNQTDLGLPDIDIPPEVEQMAADYSQRIQDGVKTALDYLHGLTGVDLSNMTYDELAKRLGIRYDSAVWALANARGNVNELAAVQQMHFDPTTGNPITASQEYLLQHAHASMSVGGPRELALLYTAPAKVPKESIPPGAPRIARLFLQPADGPDGATAVTVAQGALTANQNPNEGAIEIGVASLVALSLAAAAWWFKWPPQIFGKR